MDTQKELRIPFDKASAQLLYTVSSTLFPILASIVIILTIVSMLPTIPLPLFYLLLVLEIFLSLLQCYMPGCFIMHAERLNTVPSDLR